MARYLIRRVLFLAFVLLVVSFLTFLIFLKLPAGDPARRAVGRRTTPEIVAQARKNLGLDRPWYVQYGRFAKGLVPWPGLFLDEDVYFSYDGFVPVKEEIYARLPVTLVLTGGAVLLWLAISIPIGVASAVRPGSLVARAGTLFSLVGVSMPTFWLGYLLLFVFWFKLGWLPGSGIPIGQSVLGAVLEGRFVLPWLVLSMAFAAFYVRMVRHNLAEALGEDYIRTARAKGVPERRVVLRHGLRAAVTPMVTLLGLDVGILLGGAVVTETVFNLPGLGRYAVDALRANDLPALMGVTVFGAVFVVVANLVVDVAYAFLDPRVRYR